MATYDAQIQYLESTGTQYIDTGIVSQNNLVYYFKLIETTNNNQRRFFGFKEGSSWRSSGMNDANWGSSFFYVDFAGAENSINSLKNSTSRNSNGVYCFNFTDGNASLTHNGTKVWTSTSSGTYDGSATVYLFSMNYSGQGSSNLGIGRIYYFKVVKNGSYLIDMIPVRVGQTGYMYDRISGNLYGNQGTGNFVLGPDAPRDYDFAGGQFISHRRRIMSIKTIPVISFADPEVKRICVEQWGGALGGSAGNSTRYSGSRIKGLVGELSYEQAADVKTIENNLFKGNNIIETFDELQYFTHLTVIDGSGFCNCTNLRSIVLPDSLVRMGPTNRYTYSQGVFMNTKLLSITLPNNMTHISDCAFRGCASLVSITWGDSLTFPQHSQTFIDCTKLENIYNFPSNVTRVNSNDFMHCTKLDLSIIDFSKLTFIDSQAFEGDTNLPSTIIFSSLTSFSNYAFRNSSVRYFYFPALTALDQYNLAYTEATLADFGAGLTTCKMHVQVKTRTIVFRTKTMLSSSSYLNNGGQISKVYVYSDIYNDFITKFTGLASKTYEIGGSEWETQFGSTNEWADYPNGINPLVNNS